tara:strand:- start:1111 stop:1458 length:348 start_codon:yes stop_codon:yes gene_type:complete
MNKILNFAIISLLFCFFAPIATNAAEILQISNSSTLLIGDQNRNYTVKIACLDVADTDSTDVINLLNSELPRHSRVNLQPRGSKDGILYAKIITIPGNVDIAEKIVSNNLAINRC